MKTCTGCGESKRVSEFCRKSAYPDGRNSQCKPCINTYNRNRHREKMLDPGYVLAKRRRNRREMRLKWAKDPAHRERRNEWRRKTRPRIWTAHREANTIVRRAIRSGQLIPAEACERCGHDFSEFRREAHHADYSKPLDVEWLCRRCHGREHRKQDSGVVAA